MVAHLLVFYSATYGHIFMQPMVTFSYPLPHSGGMHRDMRSMRLVMKRKCKSLRKRIISHAAGRHSSAVSRKKSELKHVYTSEPDGIL